MSTCYRTTPQEKRALDLMIKLTRAADSVLSATRREFQRAGLTEGQFAVLEALHHLGPMSQQTIARKILVTKGNMTMIVNNLLKKGYVSKTKHPDDRRRSSVSISPAGEALIRRIFPAHVRGILEAVSVLTDEEQERLASLCRKLGRSLADRSITGSCPY